MFQSFEPAAHFREIAPPQADQSPALDVEQRFPQLIGLDQPAAATLARRRAVVVGNGSVGRRIALHLARQAVDTLWLADPAHYDDRANLVTQEITPADLDTAKATGTGDACKAISPGTRVFVYDGKVQDLDPVSMADADVVFLATDHLAVEVDVSNRFRPLGIPLVQAAVHGETLVAQVRFVTNRSADGPCLICGFGQHEVEHMNRASVFSCNGAANGHSANGHSANGHSEYGNSANGNSATEHIQVMPTMSTSFLCSLAADLALTQWTRHVLNLGQPVANTLLQYCGFTHHTTQSELVQNTNCPCDHTVLQRIRSQQAMAECSLSDLAVSAGHHAGSLAGVSFTLDDLSYVESAVCRCDSHQVNQFLAANEALRGCAACGTQLVPQPFFTHRPTPGHLLNLQRDRPLKTLGAESAAWAVVRRGASGALICEETLS